ncbi:MAG: DUF4445 domain-containing protein [Clostridia bacterium]|nr:DUF4445 domain-containing protein [Clostridia bacterium]
MITVTVNGVKVQAEVGDLLSEIIRGEKPCGGHGRCGKCRVVAKGFLSAPSESELKLLTRGETERGVRLACLTRALGDCDVETNEEISREQIITSGATEDFELDPIFERYGVAIDIGTTTLAARLYGADGSLLAELAEINPQIEWAADVISRVEAALSGKESELAQAIRQALDGMIGKLSAIADIDTKAIDGVVVTGNTVMLSLLVGESVEPFAHAPFDAKRLFGEYIEASELELHSLEADTRVYLPPCISAFVGADTTCAIIATGLLKSECAMLVDIGTNGEIALNNNGRLAVCSTAAGPAFEGVGITMGMRGAAGAIDKVYIEDGGIKAHVVGDTAPVGICGSGLVDAVACMLENEIIDESGYLEDDEFTILSPVYLTPKDIRMLQLAKSAICAGILTLIKTEKIDISNISRLYIAGGFGSYLNLESASRIGLIPRALKDKAVTVGNAALGGAAMMLLDRGAMDKAEKLSKSAFVVELSSNPIFSDLYMSGMMLEPTE